MTASTKTTEQHPEARDDEPAKGGTQRPHQEAYPPGDSLKHHGDKFEHAIEKPSERKAG